MICRHEGRIPRAALLTHGLTPPCDFRPLPRLIHTPEVSGSSREPALQAISGARPEQAPQAYPWMVAINPLYKLRELAQCSTSQFTDHSPPRSPGRFTAHTSSSRSPGRSYHAAPQAASRCRVLFLCRIVQALKPPDVPFLASHRERPRVCTLQLVSCSSRSIGHLSFCPAPQAVLRQQFSLCFNSQSIAYSTVLRLSSRSLHTTPQDDLHC